jgi:N,N'-diacetyllegionaminate synthase
MFCYEHMIAIVEVGVNYNGSFSMAEDMIVAAKQSGADYIKAQTGVPKLIISKFAQKADCQKILALMSHRFFVSSEPMD